MEDKKSNNIWFRSLDLIVGIVLVICSVVIFFSMQTSLTMVFNLLILSVLLLGTSKLVSGIVTKEMTNGYRWINIGSGTISILLALYVFFFPPAAIATKTIILMVGLLFYGIDSFVVGFAKGFSGSIKMLLIVSGFISIVASLLGFYDSTLATITAVSFISLALLVDGVEELTAGITGHTAF